MVTIKRYSPADRPAWDSFVDSAKNATFLHRRGYMDYHADRFEDFSLMAYDSRGRLIALLPANVKESALYSHQGLTYGGWLTPVRHFSAVTMLEVFDAMMAFLRGQGITQLIYKAMPYIYHRYPADEDIYALFRHGARIVECDISATAIGGSPLNKYGNSTKLNIKKTKRTGLSVVESQDFAEFWTMLESHLQNRYGVRPVHTLAEIELLRGRFPKQIRLFVVKREGRTIAGCVFYVTDTVAHAQYTGNTEEGMRLDAVAYLHDYLMNEVFRGMPYYDFGTCNERQGLYLNEGLIVQKNGLGGRGVAYVTYKVEVK